jgi:stalled ribosome rescue protein Dom34
VTHAHAVVWLDHTEAKIIQFNPDGAEESHLKHHIGKPHHKDRKDPGHAHPERDPHFYHEVAIALKGVREILVVGPGSAKTELVKHLKDHDPEVAKAVLGVESADHPTDGQILAHARTFFKAKDRTIEH